MTAKQVKEYINKKIPVIILLQAWAKNKITDWEKNWKNGHYVVAIGYGRDKFYFEDPASALRTYLKYNEFEKRWHDLRDKKKYIHFGFAVFGKKVKNKKEIHMK